MVDQKKNELSGAERFKSALLSGGVSSRGRQRGVTLRRQDEDTIAKANAAIVEAQGNIHDTKKLLNEERDYCTKSDVMYDDWVSQLPHGTKEDLLKYTRNLKESVVNYF